MGRGEHLQINKAIFVIFLEKDNDKSEAFLRYMYVCLTESLLTAQLAFPERKKCPYT